MSAWRLSPLQWHPFTAMPGPQPRTLLSVIKRYGRWTDSLMAGCACMYISEMEDFIWHAHFTIWYLTEFGSHDSLLQCAGCGREMILL